MAFEPGSPLCMTTPSTKCQYSYICVLEKRSCREQIHHQHFLHQLFNSVNKTKISAFKTWWKKSENSKIKILFISWSQCVLTHMKQYQCSKLDIYLVTLFLSEWGYFVYIVIQLRLSPAPTSRALKTRGPQALTVTWVSQTLHLLLVGGAHICISTAPS